MAYIDENQGTGHFLLSASLMQRFAVQKGIRDYLGRLCHNNKTRITRFFANPAANLEFLYKAPLGSKFVEEFKNQLDVGQKGKILFTEEMPLEEILSFRKEQLQAADPCPGQGPARDYPCQTVVEAISFKLGQFLIAEDSQGILIIILLMHLFLITSRNNTW